MIVKKSSKKASVANQSIPQATADIADKRQFAERWKASVRWVDTMLAKGLPHIKTSPRRVRIFVAEADAWLCEKFGVQRAA